jgi:hypothetical protein
VTAHPSPKQLAAYLHRLADKLDTHGGRALDMAEVLAGRGYPTSTAGNGSRSSDTTSSTERAALVGAPEDRNTPWRPGEWEDADRRLHTHLRALHQAALKAESGVDTVLAHGTTNDQLPPGTGECTCGTNCAPDRKGPTFCSPRQNGPSDRLKVGLAPNCYKRFDRWRDGNPGGTVVDWKHATRRAREIADERARALTASR